MYGAALSRKHDAQPTPRSVLGVREAGFGESRNPTAECGSLPDYEEPRALTPLRVDEAQAVHAARLIGRE